MTADTPKTDRNPPSTEAPDNDLSAAARYERGEIDIVTLVALVPESAVPPSLRPLYLAARQAIDQPQVRAEQDQRRRDERSREVLDQLGLWRLQRGEGYVAAYQEFQTTGKAIDSVQKNVFESDWFRQLQQIREREIAGLEEKQRAGHLSPEETDRWESLKKSYQGDERVRDEWKSLADDYQKLKARENAGQMDEKELRETETRLRQRMFEQLDKASPELRERMLAQLAASDPNFDREYENRLHAQGQAQPVVASNAAEVEMVKNPQRFLADTTTQELFAGVDVETHFTSTAKEQGFEDGIKARVDIGDHFAAAVSRDPAATPQSDIGGPDMTRTSKVPTAGIA